MRLSIVTETFPPEINGVAMTLGRIASGLCQRGYAIRLIRPSQGVGDRGDADSPRGLRTTRVRGIPLPGYPGLRLGLPARDNLARLWHRERPQAIYVATEGPLGWSAIRAAETHGIPVLSGFHTNFHQYSRYYGASVLQNAIYGYLRKLHNRSRCTVVPTEALRDTLEQNDFRNVEVLGRGVDRRLFSPTRRSKVLRHAWGILDKQRVALYVGRVSAEKNIELAIETYLAMRRLDPMLRMVVVGDGPHTEYLKRRYTGIIFAGPRTGADLASHYASADYFLFPSETETFGNVTLEAMASGLAVIAYDYAAAAKFIRHGENGFLVRPGDREGYLELARSVATWNGDLQRLRLAARESTREHDWSKVVDRFEQLMHCYGGISHDGTH